MAQPQQDTVWRLEVRAFLEEIKAHPEDDTPRLILADWLEEHGDPVRAARGELLRLQCRAPRTTRDRQQALLKQFEAEWLGPLAPLVRNRGCERGLFYLEIEAALLLDDPRGLVQEEAFAWVDGLRLRGLTGELAERLALSPWLTWINTLDLDGTPIGDQGVRALADSPFLSNLCMLLLRKNQLGDASAVALARSPGLTALRVLSLTDNEIGADGARALAASPHLAHLTLLNLAGNRRLQSAMGVLRAAARKHPRLWLQPG